MRVVRGTEAPRVRWRNDGGWTRELAHESTPAGDAFAWRVSIAEVEANGPFSRFDGYDRILVLLDGSGMDLHFTDAADTVQLRPDSRCIRFAGEAPVEAVLVDGGTTDCNLIWRRDAFHVTVHDGVAGEMTPHGADGVRGVVYVVDGQVEAPGGTVAGPGDLVVGAIGEPLPGGCTGRSITFLLAPIR